VLSLTLALTLLSVEAPRALTQVPAWGESIAERVMTAAQVLQQRPGPPSYAAEARAVTNWRREAAFALDPVPLSALAALFQLDRPIVARCVRLNNYWCIKSARWNGEIGSDEEGHTGFASAEQGADAAATLLRRYYLEFGRKSALDIVRRWAPAECRTVVAGTALPSVLAVRGVANTLRARWLAAHRRPQPRRIKLASVGNAIPAPVQKPPQASPPQAQPPRARPQAPPRVSRVSAVPSRPMPTFRMPTIAAGVGEGKVVTVSATLAPRAPIRRQPTPASVAAAQRAMQARTTAPLTPPARPGPGTAVAASKPQRMAAAPSRPAPAPPAAAPRAQPVRTAAIAPSVQPQRPAAPTATDAAPPPALPVLRPVVSCASDEQRIQNYAVRIVQGLGLGPRDDLKLFENDGRPLPNLSRVMLAMSSVELGVLRANAHLVEGAVARATLRAQQAAADADKPDPGAIPTPPI
jgi:hypothetical protein